jgi:glycosyltransferase involved in cell wall biosynthesis
VLRGWQRARASLDGSTTSTLVLAGRPEGRRGRLEALARELQIEDSVRFVGDVDDVAGLLGASDVGVLNSPAEGCPNALLESMAAGLPVVGSDVPGIREVLGGAEESMLVPAGDAEALGGVLARFSLDGDLRARVGARNRERQLALFGADRMLDTSVRLIVDALEAAGRPLEHAGAYAGANP